MIYILDCLDQSSNFLFCPSFHLFALLFWISSILSSTHFWILFLTWLIISKNTAFSASFLFHFLLVWHGCSTSSLMKLSIICEVSDAHVPFFSPCFFSVYWFQFFLKHLEIFGSLHTYKGSTYSYLKVKHWNAIWKLYIRAKLTN